MGVPRKISVKRRVSPWKCPLKDMTVKGGVR